jgi:hypothetical protein
VPEDAVWRPEGRSPHGQVGGEDVARESILLTTPCSLPVALLVAVLLG